MNTLSALQALNAALALGVNGLATAQKIGRVLESAQSEDRPINEDEWGAIVREADAADDKLAQSIRAKRVR